jgi:ribose transport system substrate-binding protein
MKGREDMHTFKIGFSGMAAGVLMALTAGGASAQDCIATSPAKVGQWCPHDGPLKIALIQATTSHSFHNTLAMGAKAAGKDLGVEVDVQGAAEFSPAAQQPLINAVIQSKPDALIVTPTSPDALDGVLAQVAKDGIVVVTADSDSNDKSLRLFNLTSNNVLGGEMAGKLVAAWLAGKGPSAVGTVASVVGASAEQERLKGFMEALKGQPDVTVLDTQYCGMQPAACAQTTGDILQREPTLRAMFAPGEPTGKGAATGAAASGKKADILVGAFDGSPAQKDQITAGEIDFLVLQHPYQIGYESVRLLVDVLKGQKVADSAVVEAGTEPAAIPSNISMPFTLAVHDKSICPTDKTVVCGQYDDPDVSKWFYQ